MGGNENTSRRGIYLPPELLEQYANESDKNGVKVNKLMVDALTAYANGRFGKKKPQSINEIEKIVNRLLKENGLIK